VQLPTWDTVENVNKIICDKSGALHGQNPETYQRTKDIWETFRCESHQIEDCLDFLLAAHRESPFLFFNGNSFASIGATVLSSELGDLPPLKLKTATSAAAHYITGVLDKESMRTIVKEMTEVHLFKQGNRVQTHGGSMHGTIKE
jgi:hypothetical protein